VKVLTNASQGLKNPHPGMRVFSDLSES